MCQCVCVHAVAARPSPCEVHLNARINPQCVLNLATNPAASLYILLQDSLMLVWVVSGSTNFSNFLVDSEVVITVRLLH